MKDPFERDGVGRLLSEKQHAYLEGWVQRNAETLGLREWEVRASPYPTDSATADATTWIADQVDSLVVAVSVEFIDNDTPEERRQTLAHELLHPYFHRVTRIAERLIAGELGTRTEAVIEEAIEVFEELSLDRLSRAIAKWLEPFELPAA